MQQREVEVSLLEERLFLQEAVLVKTGLQLMR